MSSPRRTVVEVGALAPLDAKTAKVLGGGVHWRPEVKAPPNYVREEEGTLPTRPIPPETRLSPSFEDLTGRRFGSLVVKGLGLLSKPARWVVRCDCGAYEHRKTIALRSLSPERLCCSHCDYLRELKAGRITNRGPFNKDQAPPP